jgi:hypothetical protein
VQLTWHVASDGASHYLLAQAINMQLVESKDEGAAAIVC